MATAIYIIDLKKIDTITRQSWGNRYLVSAADLTAALSAVPYISTAEEVIHFDRVSIDSARVATLAANDGVYDTVRLDLFGSGITTGKTMPLFCTFQPQFHVIGGGRPLRKHYHTLFDDVSYDADGSYDNTVLGTWGVALGQMLTDLAGNGTPMVDPQGNEADSAGGGGFVTFHQFTKASKRALPL